MSLITAALYDLRSAEHALTKHAYQPMLEAAAPAMPAGVPPMPAGMPPAPAGDPNAAAVPAAEPAAMPPPEAAAPPPEAGDPQAMMEMVAALESIGQALSSLTSRMVEIEKEQKSMMKDFLRAQGEQKILVQFLRQQAPMGSEIAGAPDTAVPPETGMPPMALSGGM